MIESNVSQELLVFFLFTFGIMGGAGFLMGRAIAGTWRPLWWVGFYSCGLGAADRFLVYALFQGDLSSLIGYLVDTAAIFLLGVLAYRLTQVAVLVRQYPWLFERTGWLTVRGLSVETETPVSTKPKR